jgi:hypothetical protein
VVATLRTGLIAPTTKAVDAAAVLARMLVPEPMRPGWPESLHHAHRERRGQARHHSRDDQLRPGPGLACWQNRPHEGLSHTWGEGRDLSPNEMFAACVGISGYVPLPLTGDDYAENAARLPGVTASPASPRGSSGLARPACRP